VIPVSRPYREAVQVVLAEWASVKSIPSLASRSMLGVAIFDSGL
jgi:hypothetical protein